MDESDRLEHGLPDPIDAGSSPLLPRNLVDLFFRPRSFFEGQLALGRTPYAWFVAWCFGAAQAIDRLDQNLMREEYGQPRPGWEQIAPYVTESWVGFWAFLLVFGALSGLAIWWIGGWWFALRLRWSGAEAPDARLARLVMVYSAFIQTGPAVLAMVLNTIAFPNYKAAFANDAYYMLVLVVFPFWSVVASYSGAKCLFGLSGWRVRMWFLILPILAYLTVIGGIATLFALIPEPSSAQP